jgi:hypothetical protein
MGRAADHTPGPEDRLLFFSRLNHQALQQSPLVGGGIDAVLTAAHPSLPSTPLPQDPMRPRQPQARQQQRLVQVGDGREVRELPSPSRQCSPAVIPSLEPLTPGAKLVPFSSPCPVSTRWGRRGLFTEPPFPLTRVKGQASRWMPYLTV